MLGRVRTAVLVSGGGTNLQALIGARDRGELPSCELALVLSDRPGAFALERAARAGIPSAVVDHENRRDFGRAVLDTLTRYGIEFVVCAGFLPILNGDFCAAYAGRCVNVHPSLLPDFGGKGMYGLHVHEAVLSSGRAVTGATVHYVSDIVDGGEIIRQKTVPVRPGDTPETLQRRVMEQAEWSILPMAAEDCCRGILQARAKHAGG